LCITMDPALAFFGKPPEVVDQQLSHGHALCTAYNRAGTLLAVGCNDGRLVVWDFQVRAIVRLLIGHVKAITSVDWSREGRHLVSAATDWTVLLWDAVRAVVVRKISFQSPVLGAWLHPSLSYILARPYMESPCLVTLGDDDRTTRQPLPVLLGVDQPADPKKLRVHSMACALEKNHDKVYAGNGRGVLAVYTIPSLEVERSCEVPGGVGVKALCFSSSGRFLLANCVDRSIKLYASQDLEYLREFKDPVQHLQWKAFSFSSDEEYVMAGVAERALHNIYLWTRDGGRLEKRLEGPPEGVMDLQWHPHEPFIVSCSTFGTIYIWAVKKTENWSAFAPDFETLPENVPYIELEGEFDDQEDSLDSGAADTIQEPADNEDVVIEDDSDAESSTSKGVWYLPPHEDLL